MPPCHCSAIRPSSLHTIHLYKFPDLAFASISTRNSCKIATGLSMTTSIATSLSCSHGITTSRSSHAPALEVRAGGLKTGGLRGVGFENGRGSSSWAMSGAFRSRILGHSSRRAGAVRRRTKIVAEEEKEDVFRAAGFIVKAGKNALDAGTDLVPSTIPRNVARIIVGVVGVSVITYAFRALFSTALFILAIAGFSYLAYIYLNKDSGTGGGGGGGSSRSTDDSLDEARRIMDKYK